MSNDATEHGCSADIGIKEMNILHMSKIIFIQCEADT